MYNCKHDRNDVCLASACWDADTGIRWHCAFTEPQTAISVAVNSLSSFQAFLCPLINGSAGEHFTNCVDLLADSQSCWLPGRLVGRLGCQLLSGFLGSLKTCSILFKDVSSWTFQLFGLQLSPGLGWHHKYACVIWTNTHMQIWYSSEVTDAKKKS